MTQRSEPVCREVVELVTDYLEGALAPDERAAFERHVANCAGCAAYVGQMRIVMRSARALGQGTAAALAEPPVDPRVLARLLDAWRDVRGAGDRSA